MTRCALASLLALLMAANTLFLHIHIRTATCPVTTTDDRNAQQLLVLVIGLGRVGDPRCTAP